MVGGKKRGIAATAFDFAIKAMNALQTQRHSADKNNIL